MRHALNLIDPGLLPVPTRPPVSVLLGVLVLAVGGLGVHYSWERTQFERTLALPGVTESGLEGEEHADPAHAQRLHRVVRDEALADALSGIIDLPRDSAARLRALTQALPDSLWLTEVELGGRSGLRIAGGTLDSAALAPYVARLGQIDGLQGLPLQVVSMEPHQPESASLDGEPAAVADAPAVKPVAPPAQHRFVLEGGGLSADEGQLR